MESGSGTRVPENEGPAVEIKESPTEQVTERSAAKDLQERLTKFAASETAEREEALPELVAFIKDNADAEVVGKLVDRREGFQSRLEEAVHLTLRATFETADGRIIVPWQGGHTVVVLDRNGEVKGAVSVPTEGLEDYGDLSKYALIKALCELHLDETHKLGGLSNQRNFRYLESIGLKAGEDLFTGSTTHIILRTDLYHEILFVGSSGCAPEKSYLKELLAGAEPTRDTQAGLFDTVFSDITSRFLSSHKGGRIPTMTFPEPKAIQQLRINN